MLPISRSPARTETRNSGDAAACTPSTSSTNVSAFAFETFSVTVTGFAPITIGFAWRMTSSFCMTLRAARTKGSMPSATRGEGRLLPPMRAPLAEAGEVDGELFQAGQVVHGEEVVDVWQRGHDAARERLVIRGAEEGVEPDEAAAAALEARDLAAQHGRVAAVPAVADDERQCAMAEDAAGPGEVEGAQRVADPRAAGPVGHGVRHLTQRAVEVALAELARDARQARGEDERLHLLLQRAGQAVGEEQQQPRVALHRAAHVGDDDERPRLRLRLALRPAEDLAPGAELWRHGGGAD